MEGQEMAIVAVLTTRSSGVLAILASGVKLVRDTDSSRDVPPAMALSSAEVFRPDPPPLAVLRGALATGLPCYDAVVAEHVPLLPGGESCRSCGFVYSGRQVSPALILASAGFPLLADRVRIVPADREYGAVCELTVAVQRMGARLDVISERVAPFPAKKTWPASWWTRIAGFRR